MNAVRDKKIVLMNVEPGLNPGPEELANTILCRTGLLPRKKGATDKMHRVLLELYERSKIAYRQKRLEKAVMTVEEMGAYASISRQTMYDYLSRWTDLAIVAKTSYITDGRVVIGYKLNGTTLESAFEKAVVSIRSNLETTQRFIRELQRTIKNEKISEAQKQNSEGASIDSEEPAEPIPLVDAKISDFDGGNNL
ncbi:MAG TPA: hypothetical protein VJI75_02590 [Candidatus Nanoarchaeia archaeon]|nr:hypothetical protein [Candidatus Nanoarchaeia archaeon]